MFSQFKSLISDRINLAKYDNKTIIIMKIYFQNITIRSNQKIIFGESCKKLKIDESLKNQKIFFKKSILTAEFNKIWAKIQITNNGRKNQNNKLKTLLDFRSECIVLNNIQKTGIIKEKNHKTKSLLLTKKFSHHQFIHQLNSNNFICKLNTENKRNHIITQK